jgi:hypothetical protein
LTCCFKNVKENSGEEPAEEEEARRANCNYLKFKKAQKRATKMNANGEKRPISPERLGQFGSFLEALFGP